jgi:hypothetical protein
MKLLNSGNSKTRKGEKSGWKTYGIHLAPSNLSSFNVCKDATVGCAAACLNTAGRGAMSSVQLARIAKTRLFFNDKNTFLEMLWNEVASAIKSAEKQDMKPCFRLNLTSDIPWEKVRREGVSIFEAFPRVQFYDYTKSAERMTKFLSKEMPKNYHLTYSRSEETLDLEITAVLSSGGNVACVFSDALPATHLGFPVVDGDLDDLRFIDNSGVIVGLSAKGKAKGEQSGFVIQSQGGAK